MNINLIKIIRDRRASKKILEEQRIRHETIEYLSQRGLLKYSVN